MSVYVEVHLTFTVSVYKYFIWQIPMWKKYFIIYILSEIGMMTMHDDTILPK